MSACVSFFQAYMVGAVLTAIVTLLIMLSGKGRR